MKSKLLEHLASLLFVTLVLGLVLTGINMGKSTRAREQLASLGGLQDLTGVDLNLPFEKALLADVMDIYHPGAHDRNADLVRAIADHQEKQLSHRLQRSHVEQKLSAEKLLRIGGMYLKFLAVYILVMALTYYGVETVAVWRFCRERRRGAVGAGAFAGRIAGGIASFLLFCPAYVIAYSIRTELNTDTVFFMVLLGTVSNGLLILYANKFHTFLCAESRKGYVETARVKNLGESYSSHDKDGIATRAILKIRKRFPGHVLDHIFPNARVQYMPAIKEQASFLITGLIIIEMALNIHGHLSYEMLRQLLYKNYDVVVIIILGIFYTVKMTEMFADWMAHRTSLRYSNHSRGGRP